MNIKQKLIAIKKQLLGEENKDTKKLSGTPMTKEDIENFPVSKTHRKNNQQSKEELASIRSVYLDAKVDEYIKWYSENIVKENYTHIGEFWEPIDLRNFIEKMAVWYELRYPDYEINRLMPGSGQEGTKISDVMFDNNRYINDLFDKNSDVRDIDWDEFYNTHAFIQALPWSERYRFQRVRYARLVYLYPDYPHYTSIHLHLTRNGFVRDAEGIDLYSDFKVTNEELNGMHVKDVVKLFKERGIFLPNDNELEATIKSEDNWIKQKEGMLDAVMYRIIERGGNRIGPRRGFLFAKEFGRNIDIPIMYGIDRSDPGLRSFINEYLKAGGSKDLNCYIGYFSRTSNTQKFEKISIKKLLLKQNSNASIFYTPEEIALYQRMVNAICNKRDYEEIKRKEEKQLRLQRKLKK